jgi:repressor LexA
VNILGGIRTKNPELMKKIIDYSEEYFFEYKKSPSMGEISKALKISRSTAYKYLVEMDSKGMLYYDGETIKTKKMLKNNYNTVKVPILGNIVCGTPEYAEENFEEYISLPESLFGGGEMFILRTHGDSMIEAGIDDGDLVVVKKQNTASDGDIVVALVESETTLKTLHFDDSGHIVLHPENKEMEDIHPHECYIQGIAKHIIKSI